MNYNNLDFSMKRKNEQEIMPRDVNEDVRNHIVNDIIRVPETSLALTHYKIPPQETINEGAVNAEGNRYLASSEETSPLGNPEVCTLPAQQLSSEEPLIFQPLPTATLTFEEIIEKAYLYVDKTHYMGKLIASEFRCFSLFRPRRFGKTLFVQTIKSFFRGKNKLFENLSITKDYPEINCERYPIIHMDLSDYNGATNDQLITLLNDDVSMLAKENGIVLECKSYQKRFAELIKKMALSDEKHKKVVVLIDEVETPFRVYEDENEHKKNCVTMKNFLTEIKRCTQYVKFCLLVGITNLTSADVFSGFNQITPLDEFGIDFAAIVGFTEEELKQNFDSHVRRLAQEVNVKTEEIYLDIRRRYNGFRFTWLPVSVYNPCSLIEYIRTKRERVNFFSRSGGSSFFENQILRNFDFSNSLFQNSLIKNFTNEPSNIVVEENVLFGSGTADISNEEYWASMFFQIGMLTIQNYKRTDSGSKYSLGFSNYENQSFYLKTLSRTVGNTSSAIVSTAKDAKEAILKNHWESFINQVDKFIAQFPHNLMTFEKSTESVFQLIMWIMFHKMGYENELEKSSIVGRADLVGTAEKCSTLILELKIESNPDDALEQSRQYVQQFLPSNKNVICMGMQFSQNTKRITKFGVSNYLPDGNCVFTIPYEKVPVTVALNLLEKEIINEDTRKFKFKLPSGKHGLRLPIGKYVQLSARINGVLENRSYTPISFDEDSGVVELVIKVYFKDTHPKFPDGGKLSQYIERMDIGNTIDFRAPFGKLEYLGYGELSIRVDGEEFPLKIHAKKLVMIAGGTGITPMLQLIRQITKDPKDRTEVSLLFANQTEKDIILRDELQQIATDHQDQFKIWYTVDNPPKDWKYDTGYVSAEMIEANLPGPNSDTFVVLCGPPPMIEFSCLPNLDKLGYSSKRLFVF